MGNSLGRTESFFKLVEHSWKNTADLLFRPFRWSIWWKLAVIVMLSGYSVAGWGGCNSNWTNNSKSQRVTSSSEVTTQSTQYDESDTITSGSIETSKSEAEDVPITYDTVNDWLSSAKQRVGQFGVIIGILVMLMIIWHIFWCWVSARFAYVLIESATTHTVAIAEPFKRYREIARSYFLLLVVLGLLSWLLVLGAVWLMGSAFLDLYAKMPDQVLSAFLIQNLWTLIGSAIAAVVGFIVIGLLWMIAWIWVIDFVVPIIYLRNCSLIDAWNATMSIVRSSWLEAVKYLLCRAVINLAVGMLYMLAWLLAIIAIVIVGGLIALCSYLLVMAIPALMWFIIGIWIILLIILFGGIILFHLLLMVPGSILLRTFSLKYLQSLRVGYKFFQDDRSDGETVKVV